MNNNRHQQIQIMEIIREVEREQAKAKVAPLEHPGKKAPSELPSFQLVVDDTYLAIDRKGMTKNESIETLPMSYDVDVRDHQLKAYHRQTPESLLDEVIKVSEQDDSTERTFTPMDDDYVSVDIARPLSTLSSPT